MARLAVIEPVDATGKSKEIFDGPLKGKHFNMFKSMANSPAALQAYLGLAGALGHGVLTGAEREVIALAISEVNGCDYCVAAHTVIGKSAGLTESQTIDARNGALKDSKLGALATFASALHERRGFVTDEDLARVRAVGYTDAHIAEIIANYALAIYTNYFNHVNDTTSDFPPAPALAAH